MYSHSSWSAFDLHLVRGPKAFKLHLKKETGPWKCDHEKCLLTWDNYMVCDINIPKSLMNTCLFGVHSQIKTYDHTSKKWNEKKKEKRKEKNTLVLTSPEWIWTCSPFIDYGQPCVWFSAFLKHTSLIQLSCSIQKIDHEMPSFSKARSIHQGQCFMDEVSY